MRRCATFVVALAVLAAACTGGTTAAPSPSRGPVGGTLTIGMVNVSYWGMDPRDEWNAATWELLRCCLVRTLMSYDVSGTTDDLRPVPDLAAGPPEVSPDGLTWTFRLREGLHYAPPLDAVEITSGDVVRALERTADLHDPEAPALPAYFTMIEGFEAFASGEASSIVGLQTPDAHTLRIVTSRLDSSLLYLLALPLSAPVPPLPGDEDAPFGVASGYPEPFPSGGVDSYGRVLVASGPYMYEGLGEVDFTETADERTPASGFTPWEVDVENDFRTTAHGSITLVRNPSWRPEDDPLRAALADRIEVVGGEGDELFDRMVAGELHMVFDEVPPPPLLRRYQADPSLRPLIQAPVGSPGLIFASFNVAHPPFDDVAVRRAVAYAMDRLALAEMFGGSGTRVAQHFGPDPFEASLLASWPGIPGVGGHGDQAAARQAMAASRYASGERCTEQVCEGVPIVVRDLMEPGMPALRDALEDLGIEPDIRLKESPYDCLDPEAEVAMCVGMGWAPDFPSAAGYLDALFASDGAVPTTRLGSTPSQLRRWGYEVAHVPSLDDQIEACERELGAGQAPCWARLDQYALTQLMPAVPMGFFGALRISSPALGPFPWDEVHLQPALEWVAAPGA